jgi:hypothetical protein
MFLNRELVPALLAPGFDDVTAALGLHPTTKTVLALTDDLCWSGQIEFHGLEIIA